MWLCPKCNTSNWDDALNCNKCQADRLYRLDQYLLAFRPTDRPFYSVTLAPGKIRYLRNEAFTSGEADEWIAFLSQLSTKPIIEGPWGSDPDGVDLVDLKALAGDTSWEHECKILHGFEVLYRNYGLPTRVYCAFHSALGLESLEFAECIDAWAKDAWKDAFLVQSFVGSDQHVILDCAKDATKPEVSRMAVFKKTPFVLKQLDGVQCALEDLKATENLEQLRKSKFTTFVYVMEDLRNGLFKIGQSETPEKREKTLQSEVPEVALRFYIPAHDTAEKELHVMFDLKRVRGEWFGLSPEDVLSVINFLKQNGDLDRVSVDYQWLGKISFGA